MVDDDTGERRKKGAGGGMKLHVIDASFLLEALSLQRQRGIIDCSECRERNGRKGKEEEVAV